MTVLHKQAIKDVDGVDSTLEEQVIITEHIFGIFPDTKHDHHSVHQVRKLVEEYQEAIKYDVEVMHEWSGFIVHNHYYSLHKMKGVTVVMQ